MQNKKSISFIIFLVFLFSGVACQLFTPATTQPFEIGKPTTAPVKPATPLPAIAVMPSSDNPDEPVFVSGLIPYSSPFFVNSIAEPFVMLEDQAGFVQRNKDFEFRLESQVIGPVEDVEEGALSYYLSLPAVPQGTFVDVDQDDAEDTGVQVFAIAYWSNTWGDPFLETRDGTGWSNAYASTTTDAENDYEINGGVLIVWAPDTNQEFPSGFGADDLLFTADDPTTGIPAGYNLVNLDEEPFSFSKENHLQIDLIEGDSATNNYSDLDYEDAFKRMFEKVALEYPFTKEKGIDWNNLKETFYPRAEKANDDTEFFQLVRDFSFQFPDGHANFSFNPDVFYEDYGEGFGLLITELSDGRFIASEVLPDYPAFEAGIQPGAEIVTWDNKPVSEAVISVIPGFGPYSTDHTRRIAKTSFLTRVPPGSQVEVSYKNPGSQAVQKATLKSASEYETVFRQIASFNQDQLSLPVEGYVLPETGLGYIKIQTFGADYNLMARLWEHYITSLLEEEIPGLVIDLRENSGGSLGLALDFAGYFFEDEIELYTSSYYNEKSGEFEPVKHPATIRPAPMLYEDPIVVLISPDCISACEGFAHALSSEGRSILIGHYPSAGAFGEVGRGQYELPDGISMQFPTGRPETSDGSVLIEGKGVTPEVVVPVTLESAMGEVDAVLEQAIKTLQELID